MMNVGERAAPFLPLAGVKVLDLTIIRAGPTAVRHLSDWGAEVIRIEPPINTGEDHTGSRGGFDQQNLHRNSRGICIDLKSPDGHAAFMRLVDKADLVVENMRADVKHRLKIGFDEVHARNPRVIYGSVSGFGQTGPYANRPGVDQVVQGMAGLMSITGSPGEEPMRVGIPITDLVAGTVLAMGLAMALFERERTGVGRWVTTSLLESQVFLLDFQAARWLMDGVVAAPMGNDHPTLMPTSVFPTADGHINIAAGSTRMWIRLAAALGHPEWVERPEWATLPDRSANRDSLKAEIAQVTRTRSSDYWLALLENAGIPAGPINAIDEVFADPQVRHVGMAAPLQPPRANGCVVASPLNFSGHEGKPVVRAASAVGADTDDVLRAVGYSDAELEDLRARGVI